MLKGCSDAVSWLRVQPRLVTSCCTVDHTARTSQLVLHYVLSMLRFILSADRLPA
jgi:hypothetical protein